MEDLFKQYGGIILSGVIAIGAIGYFMTTPAQILNETRPVDVDVDISDNTELRERVKPIITAKSAVLDYNPSATFNFHDYVQAYDENGRNISEKVEIYDPTNKGYEKGVNLGVKGEYTVTYICTNNGVSSYAQASYIVE